MNKVKRNVNYRVVVNNSLERHPVYILGVDYKVKIVYKNIKITEIDVVDKTIKISLPNKFRKATNKYILDLAIDKLYEQVAIVEIERAMEKMRIMLGIAPDDYRIEEIKKLGECKDNIIIINPKVVKYNRDVIDYVILHQYCHLKYKTHSKGFYKMMEKCIPNYKEYEELGLNI